MTVFVLIKYSKKVVTDLLMFYCATKWEIYCLACVRQVRNCLYFQEVVLISRFNENKLQPMLIFIAHKLIKSSFRLGETDVIDTSNMPFLHGRIRIFVDKAVDLPDTDTAFWNIDRKDFTDPYVTGDLGEARIFKSRYILNDLNPVWEETFNVHVCHHADK